MEGKNIFFIFCCIWLNGSTTGFPFQADDDVSDSGSGIVAEPELEGLIKLNNEDFPKLYLETDKGFPIQADDDVRHSGSGIVADLELDGLIKLNNKHFVESNLENTNKVDTSRERKLPVLDQGLKNSSEKDEYQIPNMAS